MTDCIALDSETSILANALSLYERGCYLEALKCCRSLLGQHPNLAPGYQLMGDILTALSNYKSFNAYLKAIQISPCHPRCEVSYFRVAETLKNRGHIEQALRYYTAAMLANPAWVTNDLLVSGEKSAIERLIVSGAIVFDIGAQVGRWTQTVFETVPDAQVYVFEPVAENHRQLQSLWTSKPPQARLQIECLAAGKQREQRTFYHHSESSEWGSLYRRNTEVEQQHGMSTPAEIAVQTIRLDEYCTEHNIPKIDFLKIDTEGGELDVLQGAVDLLRSHRVGLIQFEYGGCWLDSGIQLATAFAQLMDSGYQLFKILPTGLLKLERFTSDLENYHWCNFLAVAPQWELSGIWSMLPTGQASYPFISWSDVTLSQQQSIPSNRKENYVPSSTVHENEYDQCMAAYQRICRMAIDSEEIFQNFKQIRDYTSVLEHVTIDMGYRYAQAITQSVQRPKIRALLQEHIENFRKNDAIGSPLVHNYPELGLFSPTTLRYIKTGIDIYINFDLNGMSVVEIGGGYGGQCLILSQIFKLKSYTILDLPGSVDLQQKYLQRHGIGNTQSLTLDEFQQNSNTRFDFVLSNYALSEIAKGVAARYLDSIVDPTPNGYFQCNSCFADASSPLHAYSRDEFVQRLTRHNSIFLENAITHDFHPSHFIAMFGDSVIGLV
jgi:putative sugar O-methyltransferase